MVRWRRHGACCRGRPVLAGIIRQAVAGEDNYDDNDNDDDDNDNDDDDNDNDDGDDDYDGDDNGDDDDDKLWQIGFQNYLNALLKTFLIKKQSSKIARRLQLRT